MAFFLLLRVKLPARAPVPDVPAAVPRQPQRVARGGHDGRAGGGRVLLRARAVPAADPARLPPPVSEQVQFAPAPAAGAVFADGFPRGARVPGGVAQDTPGPCHAGADPVRAAARPEARRDA